jgi:hypothetical protein
MKKGCSQPMQHAAKETPQRLSVQLRVIHDGDDAVEKNQICRFTETLRPGTQRDKQICNPHLYVRQHKLLSGAANLTNDGVDLL